MIRIGFVQAWLTVGGAERLVDDLVRGLDPAEFAPVVIHLFTPGAIGERLAADGWPGVSGLAASRFDPGAGRRLGRALDAQRLDVAYVYDSALPMFWMGVRRRLRPRPRLVLGFHSTGKLGDPVQHFLARRAAVPAADRLVALADSHRRFLARELGVPEARFEVVRSGVDLARFAPGLPRAEARRRAGLPAEGPLAGIVAALRPEKHHALFLGAAARVAARLPAARFVVAGDGPERAALERRAAALGIADRVHWLGTRHDVPVILRALDVAVLTSHPIVETLPVSLLEAAACGTPAVSTAVGSVDDIVVEGETGHLVPVGDEAALADRLTGLLSEPERRERMGRAARLRAEARFDARDMLRRYAQLFREAAAVPGRAGA